MAYGTGTAGMKNQNDFLQQRMHASSAQTGVFPFEQIRVGPGLNQGYTATPSGGFQQANTLEYVMPKRLEELRAGSNIKQTMDARFNTSQANQAQQQRSVVAVPENRAPKVLQEQSTDRMLPNASSAKKQLCGETYIMRNVERGLENYYVSPPIKATAKNAQRYDMDVTRLRDDDQKTHNNGNPTMTHMFNEADDYGLSNIEVPVTTKEILIEAGNRPGNIIGLMKSLMLPITNALRGTKKELYVESAREFGNMQVAFPEKATVKPPDVARTTLKETQLHCTPNTNLKGHTKTTVYDPSQSAKTTIKETLVHDTRLGNLASAQKNVYVYNPKEHARTTTRETLDKVSSTVNLRGPVKSRLHNASCPVTVRETTIRAGAKGPARIQGGKQAYENANIEVANTNRQTTQQHQQFGVVDSNSKRVGAYQDVIENIDIPLTLGEQLHHEHFGAAESANFKREVKNIENYSMNESKEQISQAINNYTPTPSGEKQIPTYDNIVLTKNYEKTIYNEHNSLEKIMQQPPEIQQCGYVTQDRHERREENDRLDTSIMDVLDNNPYKVSFVV